MVIEFIVIVLLFVLLTPGVYLNLPDNSDLTTSAFVHGIIFSVVLIFLQRNFVQMNSF